MNNPDQHPQHRQHPKMKLTSEEAEKTFECSGCKELGFGPRYQCKTPKCPFMLHERCYEARPFHSDQHKFREFMGINYKFQFSWGPPNGGRLPCDACGRDIKGFWYHGEYSGQTLDLHPCCLKLGSTMSDPNKGVKTTLTLKNKMPDNAKCARCKKNKHDDRPGWSYVSSSKEVYGYHVYCLKKIIRENWEMVYLAYHVGNRLRG